MNAPMKKPQLQDPLIRMTAREAVQALKTRQVSPAELIDAAEKRIAAVEPAVNALPTLCLARGRAHAAALQHPETPPPGYLYGLPVAIKDRVPVQRSEDRRLGKAVFRTCRSLWSPSNQKK